MGKMLESLQSTILAAIFVTVVMIFLVGSVDQYELYNDNGWFNFLFRWLHVLSGVMWIGLLWYFNFVQIPTMPAIPDAQKPAIGQHIAPVALFWFRWAAMATIVTGVILAGLNGYLVEAASLGYVGGLDDGDAGYTAIGVGMWLGAIMWFNVWFVIWPNQKIALGMVKASAKQKKAAARTAMIFSRTNTLLSVPMLYAMVSAQSLYRIS